MSLQENATELTNALTVITNPFSSSEDRKAAHQVCENFKENSPLCIPCGLHLSCKNNLPIVRHFGLQLIEHSIKFRWNNLKPAEKVYIKDNVMELLCSGTNHIVHEHAHIKDLLSRIVVEMVKREWPQQWPDMLQELNTVCSIGETQTELVLLIFLRLAEDLIQFPQLPNKRKKDIQQVLSRSMGEIFAFFMKTLIENHLKYNQLVSSANKHDQEQASAHGRLIQTTLRTLAGYVEWVSWCHITAENGLVLHQLVQNLGHSSFRLLATECLLLIVGRKGNVEDRKPILFLFSDYAMSHISSATSTSVDSAVQEEQYLFTKKLCQLLVSVGTQLATLWNTVPDVEEPATFKAYLNIIFTFTQHPSIWLNNCVLPLWICFFNHPVISKDVHVLSVIPQILEVSAKKLIKHEFQSLSEPSSTFCHLEFDSEHEFYSFLISFRGNIVQVLQSVTRLQPVVAFKYGGQTLVELLESQTSSGCKNLHSPPFHLQLDALSCYLESVANRLHVDDNLKLCPEGIDLLKLLLSFQTEDASDLSALLSCMSALFMFLKLDCSIMPTLLDKLFFATVFTLPNNSMQDAVKAAVRDCRRHAAACIVKICKNYSKLLLPAFEQISTIVKDLYKDPGRLYPSEKCLMLEAVILICNEFQDYNRQSSFIGEIIKFVLVSSEELGKEMISQDAFLSFVGLRELTLHAGINDEKDNNIGKITHFINFIFSVVRRCKWPDDVDAAEKGGFMVKASGNFSSEPYFCNPATCHLLPLMDQIFCLIRFTNGLHEPSVLSSLPKEFSSIVDIPDGEKKTILGVLYNPPESDVLNSPTYKRMRNFVYLISGTCLQILGNSAQYLGTEFYIIPNLSSIMRQSVLSSLDYLPDHKLKDIIHCYLKPLFLHCPSSCHAIVVSVLEVLCPFMLQKLSARWEEYKQQYGTSVNCENEMTETQEILKDQLNRLLTREYIDLLGCALRNKKASEVNPNAMDEEVAEVKMPNSAFGGEKLSDLGVVLLRTEGLGSSLVYTAFKSLQWLDTVASQRSTYICFGIFNQLKQDMLISNEQEASFLLQSALYALSELGEHEINQSCLISLCLHLYESMRPTFASLKDVLMQDFKCPAREVEKFDSMILHNSSQKPCSEKKKKDVFKSVVTDVIGKNVGQYFKNEIRIKNLPALFLPARCKNPRLDELENHELGLCALFGKVADCTS